MSNRMAMTELLRTLPGWEPDESPVRAATLPEAADGALLAEAEDCGFAVNRSGWWNRTSKGDDYLRAEQ